MAEEAQLRTQPPSSAVVFQCVVCAAVLGDSSAFACSHAGLRTVSLRAASHVRVLDDEPETSKEGVDAGSTYFAVKCSGCDAQVGKVYLTTPRALDLMRDAFSLESDRLKNYVLGEHELTLGEDQPENGRLESGANLRIEERMEQVEEQLLKVENLLLLYNERLEHLEGIRTGAGMNQGRNEGLHTSPKPASKRAKK